MRAVITRTAEGFQELREPWQALCREAGLDAPFHSWDWYQAWWQHFGAGDKLFLIAVHDEQGNLKAIAPLLKGTRRIRGLPVKQIRFLSNGLTPRNLIIASPASQDGALELVAEALARNSREWDMAYLENLPGAVPSAIVLRRALTDQGLIALPSKGKQSPRIKFRTPFDTFLKEHFVSKDRTGILGHLRKLERAGTCEVVEFCRAEEIERGLELAFQVSSASWKARDGSDMCGRPARRGFYVDIAQRLASQGGVRISILLLDGRPIASQFQVATERALFLMVNDYDEAQKSLSPGAGLLYQVLKEARGRGIDEYDFCGESYHYKLKWSTDVVDHHHLEVYKRRPYSYGLYQMKSRVLPFLRGIASSLRRG